MATYLLRVCSSKKFTWMQVENYQITNIRRNQALKRRQLTFSYIRPFVLSVGPPQMFCLWNAFPHSAFPRHNIWGGPKDRTKGPIYKKVSCLLFSAWIRLKFGLWYLKYQLEIMLTKTRVSIHNLALRQYRINYKVDGIYVLGVYGIGDMRYCLFCCIIVIWIKIARYLVFQAPHGDKKGMFH